MPSRLLVSRAGLAALAILSGFGSAPAFGAPAPASAHAVASGALGVTGPAASRLVDINSAAKAELKTLPGVDDATADRIVAARPYPSKAKLVADQVISYPRFLTLKNQIVALQKLPPGALQPVRSSGKP